MCINDLNTDPVPQMDKMVFFGGGGQLGRAKPKESGEKPLKICEIFISEITANAANFKT